MALSKPTFPNTVQDLPVVAQHYLVCGTEYCKKNCQFYCNPCHRQLCEQCRDEHQKSPDTKKHEVVPYRQRKIPLPVEKCKDHPNKDIDIFCRDCQVPVCSKCAMQDHGNHKLKDLEIIYSEKFTLCLEKIYDIHQLFIPNLQYKRRDIKENIDDIKNIMDDIRRSMKTETESLKCLPDTVFSDNIEKVNEMEHSIIENLHCQDKTYQDYISYLKELVKKFNGYLSSIKLRNNPLIFFRSDHLKTKPIPETTKPVPPVFTSGQCSKEDVANLLGKVTVPNTKPENRKIKPTETASTKKSSNRHLYYLLFFSLTFALFLSSSTPDLDIKYHTWEQLNIDKEKSDVKQIVSLSPSVIKVREYKVPGVDGVYHISIGKSGIIWVSDWKGNLVKTDLQGNQLQMIKTGGKHVYHTVTQDGDLMYTDINSYNNVINKITLNDTDIEFLKTGQWTPISIHSSHINGDILVGMVNGEEAKVTRFNKKGEEIQNIQKDSEGQELYSYPRYITENINGDICVSDNNKHAIVVVNKNGQYRFSYIGQKPEFRPCGICTDIIGHILVSDFISDSVHILDQDGRYLSKLLTPQELYCPISVWVDDENDIHVGQCYTNKVRVLVYKYLQ